MPGHLPHPSRHDRQRLALYATHFHPSILGVTGTPDQVAKAAQLYGVVFRRVDQGDSSLGYRLDHSADTYGGGPRG